MIITKTDELIKIDKIYNEQHFQNDCYFQNGEIQGGCHFQNGHHIVYIFVTLFNSITNIDARRSNV
jgi:hypothetical protein